MNEKTVWFLFRIFLVSYTFLVILIVLFLFFSTLSFLCPNPIANKIVEMTDLEGKQWSRKCTQNVHVRIKSNIDSLARNGIYQWNMNLIWFLHKNHLVFLNEILDLVLPNRQYLYTRGKRKLSKIFLVTMIW